MASRLRSNLDLFWREIRVRAAEAGIGGAIAVVMAFSFVLQGLPYRALQGDVDIPNRDGDADLHVLVIGGGHR